MRSCPQGAEKCLFHVASMAHASISRATFPYDADITTSPSPPGPSLVFPPFHSCRLLSSSLTSIYGAGELEGLAMTADPGFNLISVVYPYVCRRLLTDPSPSLRAALKDLIVADDGTVQW